MLRKHPAAYVGIRRHMSAYVIIRLRMLVLAWNAKKTRHRKEKKTEIHSPWAIFVCHLSWCAMPCVCVCVCLGLSCWSGQQTDVISKIAEGRIHQQRKVAYTRSLRPHTLVALSPLFNRMPRMSLITHLFVSSELRNKHMSYHVALWFLSNVFSFFFLTPLLFFLLPRLPCCFQRRSHTSRLACP